jgi:hypothetical protein
MADHIVRRAIEGFSEHRAAAAEPYPRAVISRLRTLTGWFIAEWHRYIKIRDSSRRIHEGYERTAVNRGYIEP